MRVKEPRQKVANQPVAELSLVAGRPRKARRMREAVLVRKKPKKTRNLKKVRKIRKPAFAAKNPWKRGKIREPEIAAASLLSYFKYCLAFPLVAACFKRCFSFFNCLFFF